MRHVYLDHAATSPMKPAIISAMHDYLHEPYGNPSSLHLFGEQADVHVEAVRQRMLHLLGDTHGSLIFTGSGTEANNLAFIGLARKYKRFGTHILISSIEHDSIWGAAHYLEREGFTVETVSVTRNGVLDTDQLAEKITAETILVSIMQANNETGTIQPVNQIGHIVDDARQRFGHRFPYFHCDATQSIGKIEVNVHQTPIDLLTLSAHKLGGPKGIGALYYRRGVRLDALIHGGGQEQGLRSGTQNVPAIGAFAHALDVAMEEQAAYYDHLKKINDRFRTALATIPGARFTVSQEYALPSHAHFYVERIEGQAIMLQLSRRGVAVATGSACHSSNWEPSHVMLAMGYSDDEAYQVIRASFGWNTTEEDIDYAAEHIADIARNLQANKAL